MNSIILKVFAIGIIPLCSCLLIEEENEIKEIENNAPTQEVEPHRYGGWYCPDNFTKFAPIALQNWSDVPVVQDRLPTEKEIEMGHSLISVDTVKYPNTRALNMKLPALAKHFNYSTQREEIIIVIQALNIEQDSIVGFRYLNGGNGSARLNEVDLITQKTASKYENGEYVCLNLEINAPKNKVWDLISKKEYENTFKTIFDKDKKLPSDWRQKSNINFTYLNHGEVANKFVSENFYGACYIQNDYQNNNYSEKLFLTRGKDADKTVFKIVCGPYLKDYQEQKAILERWTKKIKVESETVKRHPKVKPLLPGE